MSCDTRPPCGFWRAEPTTSSWALWLGHESPQTTQISRVAAARQAFGLTLSACARLTSPRRVGGGSPVPVTFQLPSPDRLKRHALLSDQDPKALTADALRACLPVVQTEHGGNERLFACGCRSTVLGSRISYAVCVPGPRPGALDRSCDQLDPALNRSTNGLAPNSAFKIPYRVDNH